MMKTNMAKSAYLTMRLTTLIRFSRGLIFEEISLAFMVQGIAHLNLLVKSFLLKNNK